MSEHSNWDWPIREENNHLITPILFSNWSIQNRTLAVTVKWPAKLKPWCVLWLVDDRLTWTVFWCKVLIKIFMHISTPESASEGLMKCACWTQGGYIASKSCKLVFWVWFGSCLWPQAKASACSLIPRLPDHFQRANVGDEAISLLVVSMV